MNLKLIGIFTYQKHISMNNINSNNRLKDLESYSILDTLPESDYDNLTTIASEICQTPISLISLLDDKRQWFKSHIGIDVSETPIEEAFCIHAIQEIDVPFIISDAREDNRFKNNPLVTGHPNIVFYAGIPLVSHNGNALGTLCVVDTKPKDLSTNQINSLSALADQVMNLFELRRSKNIIEKDHQNLESFCDIASSKVSSSATQINGLTKILERTDIMFDDRAIEIIDLLKEASSELKTMITELKTKSIS